MILHYDTQFTKVSDLHVFIWIYMHINIILYKIHLFNLSKELFLQSCFSRIQYCKLVPVRKYLLLSHFHEEF
jgi:hypothetical protein